MSFQTKKDDVNMILPFMDKECQQARTRAISSKYLCNK